MTLAQRYIKVKKELFEKYYSFLNEEQRRAVFSIDGHLLVLAGAGSGKTTVLVNRVEYIIKYGNAYHGEYIPANLDEGKIMRLEGAKLVPREQLGEVLTEDCQSPCPPRRMLVIPMLLKAA